MFENSFSVKIYKYKFKSERMIPTLKHALSDGNVALARLWVYKGQKHGVKVAHNDAKNVKNLRAAGRRSKTKKSSMIPERGPQNEI